MNLLDLLSSYNFRKINEEQIGMYHNDTVIVRIYIEDDLFEPGFFFEFGINDWNDDNQISNILKKEILTREVLSLNVIEDFSMLQIAVV